MRDKWFVFTRYFNYSIDVHPGRSMIIVFSIMIIAIEMSVLKLMMPTLIVYTTLIILILLRIFQDNSVGDNSAYFNKWLMVNNDRFIFIKGQNDYDAEFYIYNLSTLETKILLLNL